MTPMICLKPFRYAGKSLSAGDKFEARDKHARLLGAIGKAKYRTTAIAASPVQKVAAPDQPKAGQVPLDETAALRVEYQALYGKKPYMGWDAETLRQKIAAHQVPLSDEPDEYDDGDADDGEGDQAEDEAAGDEG